MDEKKDETYYNIKGLLKYISTVVSWTIFVLLLIIGVLLIYYYISVKLYATKGEAFEPKFSVYTIVSPSMEPTINVYDVIVNTKIDSIDDVKVNDVITFISTWNITYGMTITHRVVGTKTLDDGSKCLITRGDNNTQEDQTCVKEGDIIGIVKAVIPGLGQVQHFLSSSFGWLIAIIVPALYIIIKDIIKIIKLAKETKKEKQNGKSDDKDNAKDKNTKNKEKEIKIKEEVENKDKNIKIESETNEDVTKSQDEEVTEDIEIPKLKEKNLKFIFKKVEEPPMEEKIAEEKINYNTKNKKLMTAYDELKKDAKMSKE